MAENKDDWQLVIETTKRKWDVGLLIE